MACKALYIRKPQECVPVREAILPNGLSRVFLSPPYSYRPIVPTLLLLQSLHTTLIPNKLKPIRIV